MGIFIGKSSTHDAICHCSTKSVVQVQFNIFGKSSYSLYEKDIRVHKADVSHVAGEVAYEPRHVISNNVVF